MKATNTEDWTKALAVILFLQYLGQPSPYSQFHLTKSLLAAAFFHGRGHATSAWQPGHILQAPPDALPVPAEQQAWMWQHSSISSSAG